MDEGIPRGSVTPSPVDEVFVGGIFADFRATKAGARRIGRDGLTSVTPNETFNLSAKTATDVGLEPDLDLSPALLTFVLLVLAVVDDSGLSDIPIHNCAWAHFCGSVKYLVNISASIALVWQSSSTNVCSFNS